MTESFNAPSSRPRLSLQAVLSVLAALAATGAVCLHLLGGQIHRTYLRQWAVDSDLFPKAADWILSGGYNGLVTFGIQSLTAIFHNFLWVLLASIPLGVYVWLLLSPLGLDRLQTKQWAWLQTAWGKVAGYVLKSLLALVFLPFALFLAVAIAAIPAVIAESVGESAAEQELADFHLGCEKSKAVCVQFLKGGNEVAKGYILDSSPSHIALFDVNLQRSRTLPREGLEGVATRKMR
ncbi:hypothetical protein ACSFBF_10265 [Variovorax sp. ZT5P49]|uniref:hypothetical protein n=1 Tax=Variovorax sp. ZT5P49 TaxID=3443733 RepID=UPI003F44884F